MAFGGNRTIGIHRNYYFDKDSTKTSLMFLTALCVGNFLIFKEGLIYFAIAVYFVFRAILYSKIGNRISKFYIVQKERLPSLLLGSVALGFAIALMVRVSLVESQQLRLYSTIIGLIVFSIGLFFYFKRNEFKPRKKASDFPNLKQELVYQELDDMSVFAEYRTKKVPKYKTFTKKRFFGLWLQKKTIPDGFKTVVDYSDIDLTVTDGRTKKLTPLAKKEIMDITNGENEEFYEYSLTRISGVEEAERLLKRLTLDVSKIKKSGRGLKYKGDKAGYYKEVLDGSFDTKYDKKGRYSDGYMFPRFWYQLMDKNIKSLNNEKVKFDFLEALDLFDGIFEYAMIHMFIYHSNYFNRPIGNSPTEALYDFLYSGNKNSFELCGAMDSAIFTSVKKRGSAYIAGYLLTAKKLGLDTIKA